MTALPLTDSAGRAGRSEVPRPNGPASGAPQSRETAPAPRIASDRDGGDERAAGTPADSLGTQLRLRRESRAMSLVELARITRIPATSLQAIEADRFDELPGEVFVRGFLRAYAQAVGLLPDEILARYTSSRRIAFVTPLPMQTPLQAAREGHGRRFGVAIAFVLLLILLSLALSIVLKPRGHDMPTELSERRAPALRLTLGG